MKKIIDFLKKHFFAMQFAISFEIGVVISIITTIVQIIDELDSDYMLESPIEVLFDEIASGFGLIFIFAVLVFPFVLTLFELIYLIIAIIKGKECNIDIKKGALYDCFAFGIGVFLELFLLSFMEVIFSAQWNEELSNDSLHAPINPDFAITFIVLYALFFVGMIILSYTSHQNRPPLVTVLCMAMMYIGVIESVLFTVQIMGMNYIDYRGNVKYKFDFMLLFTILIPLNMILILFRTIIIQIKLYEPDANRMSRIDSIPILSKCNKLLCNSKNWPIAAVVMMIPVLGIVIAILALFGQAPDAAIKAFTETANYTFSTKIPPQNVFYDEHYLCTVAAGGHERIVKPIRMGKRHGHDVVVNRQLMIANAFEQVLEERTPRFHHIVRAFYDKYGIPIAKLIKSKTIADIVWFMMKPLEWMFLVVLYLVDVNPEDRIARQYT